MNLKSNRMPEKEILRRRKKNWTELQAKAQSATAAQMSTLADANKSVEEAAKAENSNTEDTTTKNNTDKSEKHRNLRGLRQRRQTA